MEDILARGDSIVTEDGYLFGVLENPEYIGKPAYVLLSALNNKGWYIARGDSLDPYSDLVEKLEKIREGLWLED